MIEVKGDIWELAKGHSILIPTNGSLNSKDHAIMGKGMALEAKRRWPGILKPLTVLVGRYGPTFGPIGYWPLGDSEVWAIAFPTKVAWYLESDLGLIESQSKALANWLQRQEETGEKVYFPHLGCGEGGLDWETQVKPVLERYFTTDRWVAVDRAT